MGGGGINVSKAISRLEGKSLCDNNWRIDRRNAELYKKNQFVLKPLKREVGHENVCS
jgi:hypothetical protein